MYHPAIVDKISKISRSVYSELGPHLPVAAYAECIAYELDLYNVAYTREVFLPVCYKNIVIDSGYTVSFIIEESVLLEIKDTEHSYKYHKKRLLTAMQMTGKRSGLLLNFHEENFSDVIRAFVL